MAYKFFFCVYNINENCPPPQLEKKTIQELKQICRERFIKGYSGLNKKELINLIKKSILSKKMKGGNNPGNNNLTIDDLKDAINVGFTVNDFKSGVVDLYIEFIRKSKDIEIIYITMARITNIVDIIWYSLKNPNLYKADEDIKEAIKQLAYIYYIMIKSDFIDILKLRKDYNRMMELLIVSVTYRRINYMLKYDKDTFEKIENKDLEKFEKKDFYDNIKEFLNSYISSLKIKFNPFISNLLKIVDIESSEWYNKFLSWFSSNIILTLCALSGPMDPNTKLYVTEDFLYYF